MQTEAETRAAQPCVQERPRGEGGHDSQPGEGSVAWPAPCFQTFDL